MKFDLRELALFAEQAVTKAGDRISELRSREKIEVKYKDSGELVTSADLLSERIINEKAILFRIAINTCRFRQHGEQYHSLQTGHSANGTRSS